MLCKEKEGEMKVTVRCYDIPADITFNRADVEAVIESEVDRNVVFLWFKDRLIAVDKYHYLEQIGKKDV